MKKLHEAIFDKRTRYDLYIKIDSASQLEQLSEAMEISKSEVAEIALNLLYKSKDSLMRSYLAHIEELKRNRKKTNNADLSLFDFGA
ncbi:hypothetical protein CIG2463D_0993 [Campylobacter iguaniorum]|uniref:hypothetical protein n=1 Tax=Campylobacter iguaniorum TaxID=1244531 RepID=UPI00073A0187|nr:hypothetical protein [Campylobacter iguaniorum]ALV24566.1 hypothetical protein CIG2463D_0993 [Campylobacter iguaniorum]